MPNTRPNRNPLGAVFACPSRTRGPFGFGPSAELGLESFTGELSRPDRALFISSFCPQAIAEPQRVVTELATKVTQDPPARLRALKSFSVPSVFNLFEFYQFYPAFARNPESLASSASRQSEWRFPHRPKRPTPSFTLPDVNRFIRSRRHP